MSFIENLQSKFADFKRERRGKEPDWLSSSRRAAFDRFLAAGLPATSDEEWRFTSLSSLKKHDFRLASGNGKSVSPAEIASHSMGDWAGNRLVFVNGRFSERLSRVERLPGGVVCQSLWEAMATRGETLASLAGDSETETAFAALNEGFFTDGAFLLVPEGVVVEKPIHLLFLTKDPAAAAMTHLRNVILARAGSQVKVVESYAGEGLYFTNTATRVVAGENAELDHYKLQRESRSAFHVASLGFEQARQATLTNHSISLGGHLTRNDIRALLAGEGADCTLNGLYAVTGSQIVDHHTLIDHAQPHCNSRELYKGVLDDEARGVFNGRIIVRRDAQKTNARQTNKNLLLSEDALVNTNPQLEINADDVRCAHGATIGQLSEEALFYLRSRGIDPASARKLLTRGFMSEVAGHIRIEAIRGELDSILFSELPPPGVGERQ